MSEARVVCHSTQLAEIEADTEILTFKKQWGVFGQISAIPTAVNKQAVTTSTHLNKTRFQPLG